MIQVLNGLTYGALLMVLTSGLALIFGLRGVMNIAHGALYMLGAYLSFVIAGHVGFWAALCAVPVILALVGLLLERFGFRYLTGHDVISVSLLTLGIAMVLEFVALKIWGPNPRSVDPPSMLSGSAQLFGMTYPTYRLFVLVAGAAVMLALAAWLSRSRVGLYVRAAVHDRETSAMMGVDIDRVSIIVVTLSTALAGLAGVLASPYLALSPSMGHEIIVPTLIIVVVGGLGSVAGAAMAAVAWGLIETVGTVVVPSVAQLLPYVALVLILLWRPTGIAGSRLH